MGVIRYLNRKGDSETYWNTNDHTAIAQAKQLFDNLPRSALKFEIQEDGSAELVNVFNPRAKEILIVPQIRGGM
jgi:hypothetical protein